MKTILKNYLIFSGLCNLRVFHFFSVLDLCFQIYMCRTVMSLLFLLVYTSLFYSCLIALAKASNTHWIKSGETTHSVFQNSYFIQNSIRQEGEIKCMMIGKEENLKKNSTYFVYLQMMCLHIFFFFHFGLQ